MTQTIKAFSLVSEAVDVFLEFSCYSCDPRMLAILSLVSLPFLNPACTSGSSWFTYCWSIAWRSALSCYHVKWVQLFEFEHCFALPFFRIGMSTDLFQSCGHCWVFQICWHIQFSTFTASSFRIWNSSAGIPSCPLALFVVMLPNAHLTSHSRMLGYRWVITPSLSGSLRSFCIFLLCIVATSS